MQTAEKIILIINDLQREIWSSGAYHFTAFAIAVTAALWFSSSRWQPKLHQLTESRFFPQRDWFYLAAVALAASLLFVVYAALNGAPIPSVQDENCYLLTAKTFAEGRITNEPHPLWQFFEHFHLISQPTYTAKYPPAQSAFLAVGILLTGHPVVGVWLGGALASVACFWMLRAFFSLNWSLFGALLALVHPTFFQWSQFYNGAYPAMIGGALCVGALFRSMKSPKTSLAVVFGVGVALLANSRPFEGLLACLPLAAAIIYRAAVKFNKPEFVRAGVFKFVIPATLVLLLNFVWMGYYNWRATGDALKLPYSLYTEQYDPVPLFLPFSELNQKAEQRHLVMKVFYEKEIENHYLPLRRSMEKITLPVLMFRRLLNSVIGILSAGFFLYLAILAFGGYALGTKFKYLFFTFAFFFCLYLAACATYYEASHYWSPFVSFFVVAATTAFAVPYRKIKTKSRKKLLISFALALIVSQSLWILVLRKATGSMPFSIPSVQIPVVQNLNEFPGRHLVVVDYANADLQTDDGRYNLPTIYSTVYNEPNIDQSKIVWANAMGARENERLFDYFKDRRVWVVGFEPSNEAKLLSCENLYSQLPPSPALAAALKNNCPAAKNESR